MNEKIKRQWPRELRVLSVGYTFNQCVGDLLWPEKYTAGAWGMFRVLGRVAADGEGFQGF